jgi:hypothetical protein
MIDTFQQQGQQNELTDVNSTYGAACEIILPNILL